MQTLTIVSDTSGGDSKCLTVRRDAALVDYVRKHGASNVIVWDMLTDSHASFFRNKNSMAPLNFISEVCPGLLPAAAEAAEAIIDKYEIDAVLWSNDANTSGGAVCKGMARFEPMERTTAKLGRAYKLIRFPHVCMTHAAPPYKARAGPTVPERLEYAAKFVVEAAKSLS